MKKVAIIGTVGVPANYGGFETLVENILRHGASNGIQYSVYCSSKAYSTKLKTYKQAKLKYIPLKANGAQSVIYDIISIVSALFSKNEVLLILGTSGAVILPVVKLFSRKKIIVNIDGLEHKRDKWSPKVRKFLKWSEKIAVKNADIVISDNKAIQDYVLREYSVHSELIAYGGDHVLCATSSIEESVLERYKIALRQYSFSLCRIEPENNVHLTLEAFSKMADQQLVFVGNWNNSEYGRSLRVKYGDYPNIWLVDPVYDIATLNVLRANAKLYIHGHSAGGTNPSLVEAMFFDASIAAFDVSYNRETTQNEADYYNDVDGLIEMFNQDIDNSLAMNRIAKKKYLWQTIAQQYENLYLIQKKVNE